MIVCTVLSITLAVYVACPYIFYYFKRVRDTFVFCHFLNIPPPWFHSLKDPEYFGVENAKTFSILSDEGSINIWNIKTTNPFIKNGKESVILYCHGQSCNRAMSHRVGMYNQLSGMGFNIVTFDYRGFGDSPGNMPSENSVVEDVRIMLQWVENNFFDHNIFVWGHSLGTGVSVRFISSLEDSSHRISGLVLESPFVNLEEAGKQFPIAKIFDFLPLTKGVISNALAGMFPTDELILHITVPILILHAKDDHILPVSNAIQLFRTCERNNMDNVQMKIVNEGKHKFLFRNKYAMEAAGNFLRDFQC